MIVKAWFSDDYAIKVVQMTMKNSYNELIVRRTRALSVAHLHGALIEQCSWCLNGGQILKVER